MISQCITKSGWALAQDFMSIHPATNPDFPDGLNTWNINYLPYGRIAEKHSIVRKIMMSFFIHSVSKSQK